MLPNEPYKGAQPFYALEVIRLHSVRFSQSTFGRLMALCPCFHTLDLRRCDCRDVLSCAGAFIPPAGENLRRITVAMCHAWETRLDTLAEKNGVDTGSMGAPVRPHLRFTPPAHEPNPTVTASVREGAELSLSYYLARERAELGSRDLGRRAVAEG